MVSMLPSLTVPKLLLKPTNEFLFENVPPLPSIPTDCSTCQIAFNPVLPRFLSPRKPRYVFCESMAWREPASVTGAPAGTVSVNDTRVDTESPGCVAPLLVAYMNCG